MKRFYRIEYESAPRYAVDEGSGEWRLVDGDPFGAYQAGRPVSSTGHRLLPPVTPSKIVAVGLNYKDHAAEQNKRLPSEPLIFLKPPSALIGHGATIELPDVGRVDYEAELGVVIGARARHVRAADAGRHVLGLTCVNDVSARVLQARDGQFTRAKGFDTFAPVGPCVATGLDYGAPGSIAVEGWLNGERRQSSTTRELIFPIDELIAFISSVMTLMPGDIISTGTPAGVGPLAAGDRVTIKVQGVGELSNPVAAAAAAR